MITIKNDIHLNEEELKFKFIKSSGPGGQNINKVSTAVQLSFDFKNSNTIPDHIKTIMLKKGGKFITKNGQIIILAKKYRSQDRNKQDAIRRLTNFILQCSIIKKARKRTYPTKASKESRIEKKKKNSQKKELRKPIKSTIK